jgi:hypothetical protein
MYRWNLITNSYAILDRKKDIKGISKNGMIYTCKLYGMLGNTHLHVDGMKDLITRKVGRKTCAGRILQKKTRSKKIEQVYQIRKAWLIVQYFKFHIVDL